MHKVFISSTARDLSAYRDAVISQEIVYDLAIARNEKQLNRIIEQARISGLQTITVQLGEIQKSILVEVLKYTIQHTLEEVCS